MTCESSVVPQQPIETATASAAPLDLPSGNHSYRLEDLAYLRSGDKGDTANIGGWVGRPAGGVHSSRPPPPLCMAGVIANIGG